MIVHAHLHRRTTVLPYRFETNDYVRCIQQAARRENAEAETPPSTVTEDEEEQEAKRKTASKPAIEKIKNAKAAKKKGKKRGSED